MTSSPRTNRKRKNWTRLRTLRWREKLWTKPNPLLKNIDIWWWNKMKNWAVRPAKKVTQRKRKFWEFIFTLPKYRYCLWRAGGRTTKSHKISQVLPILSPSIWNATFRLWKMISSFKKLNGMALWWEIAMFYATIGVPSKVQKLLMTNSTALWKNTSKRIIKRSVFGSL